MFFLETTGGFSLHFHQGQAIAKMLTGVSHLVFLALFVLKCIYIHLYISLNICSTQSRQIYSVQKRYISGIDPSIKILKLPYSAIMSRRWMKSHALLGENILLVFSNGNDTLLDIHNGLLYKLKQYSSIEKE